MQPVSLPMNPEHSLLQYLLQAWMSHICPLLRSLPQEGFAFCSMRETAFQVLHNPGTQHGFGQEKGHSTAPRDVPPTRSFCSKCWRDPTLQASSITAFKCPANQCLPEICARDRDSNSTNLAAWQRCCDRLSSHFLQCKPKVIPCIFRRA